MGLYERLSGGGGKKKGLSARLGAGTGGSSPEDPLNPSIILGVDPQAVAAGAESYAPSRADSIKSAAQDLARLTKAGKIKEAQALSKKYQAAFTKEELEALKIEVANAEGPGTVGKAFLTADNATGGALSKGMEYLDAASQASLSTLGNAKQAITGKDAFGNDVDRWGALGRAAKAWDPITGGHAESVAALDIDGDGRVTNLRESQGFDPNGYKGGVIGKALIGAADTVGTVALDPTTYMTMGGANAARQAVKRTVIDAAGEGVWKQIATEGMDRALRNGTISAAQHKMIEDGFRKQAQELAQSALAQKSSIASRLSPAARTTRKLAEAGDIEGMVGRNMDVLSRQGRSGVKFGIGEQTRTIIPTRPGGLRIPGLQREFAPAAGVLADQVDEVADAAGVAAKEYPPSVAAAIDAVKAAPAATGAGGFAKQVDAILPKTPGVVDTGVMEDGGRMLGIRAEDGTLQGYIMLTDDAVSTFESLVPEKGMGQRLLQAAEDAGVDVPKMLANSDFTDDVIDEATGEVTKRGGRSTALRYLENHPGTVRPSRVVPPSTRVPFEGDVPLPEPRPSSVPAPSTRQPFENDVPLPEARPSRMTAPSTRLPFEDGSTLPESADQRLQEILANAEAADPEEVLDALVESQAVLLSPKSPLQVVSRTDDGQLVTRLLGEDGRTGSSLIPNGGKRNPGMDAAKDRLAALFPQGEIPAAKASQLYKIGDDLKGVGQVTEVTDEFVTIRPVADVGGSVAVADDALGTSTTLPVLWRDPQRAVPETLLDEGAPTPRPIEYDKPQRVLSERLPGVEPEVGPAKPIAWRDKQRVAVQSLELDGPRPPMSKVDLSTPQRSAVDTLPLEGVTRPKGPMRPADYLSPEESPLPLRPKAVVTKESIGGAIAESDIGKWVRAAFQPRAGVKSVLGEGGERAVYQSESAGAAALNTQERDLALRLKPVRKAASALKSPPKALYEAVPALDGLRGRAAFTVLAEGLLDGSVERRALQVLTDAQEATILRGVDVLQNLDNQADEMLAGAPSPQGALLDPQRPMRPAVISQDGTKFADRVAPMLGVDPRELRPGRDISEILREQMPTAKNVRQANETLSSELGLPKGTKFFEEDIVSQVALRSRAAFRATVQADMFEKLAKETVDGKPLVRIIRKDSKDKTIPHGWVEMQGIDSSVGTVIGPEEVINEMSKVRDIIINDEALAGLSKFFDSWRRVWATGATSPLPWGTAFHARNAMGNAFNAFLAGMTNPVRFKEAQGLQRQGYKVTRQMKKTGQTWEEAAAEVLKPADLEALSAMRADGTISSGFFHDLDAAFLGQVDPKQGVAEWAIRQAKIVDSGPAKAGRKLGDAVENNARIALWLDTYAKTGSKTEAAERVKKYLFDYGDLTAVDRQIKKVMPFWTFTKKNLALQMETLAKDPWRVKNMVKVEGMLFGGGEDDAPIPEWAGKSGYRTTSVLGGGAPGTLGMAANIETPLDSALHTLDPIVQAATLVPGLRDHVPPDYRSDGSEVSRALFGMGGGGPVEFVTFLVENSTGKDMFTGGKVKEGSTFERFTNIIAPVWGKQRGLSGTVTGEMKPGLTRKLDLLRSFTGINILPLTEKERAQVAFAAKTELQEAIKALEDAGEDVPTYSELEDAGLVPDLRTLDEEHERLAKEQEEITNPSQLTGKEQTLTEINAIRALNGEPPLIGGSTGAERGGRRSLFG